MPRRPKDPRRAPVRPPGLGWAVALGVAAAAVILPDRFRVDSRFPFVDAVAWRPQASASALVVAAVLATGRSTRPAAAGVAAVASAGIAAVVGRVVVRPDPVPGRGGLSVLTVNVWKGRSDTGELATLIERAQPDFVVLPEAGPDFRDKLMPLVDVLGYRSWVSTDGGVDDGHSVTLLAAGSAGDVRVRPGAEMHLRHLQATGGILGARTLYAVHTAAPAGPASVRAWRRDMEVLRRWCGAPVVPIVAGDLNATLDHSALRAALGGCRSAATGTGHALVGTFPSSLPRWFGIQIDHVLVPASAVTTRFEIVDVAGSDHRGVLAAIRLPG